MRKIFSFMLGVAVMATASAADFNLYFGDTPANDGDNFTNGYILNIVEQDGEKVWQYKQDSNLFLQGPKGSPVRVTVESNNIGVSVCSIDGTCENCSKNNNYTVVKSGSFTGNLQSLEIEQVTNKFNDKAPTLKDIVVTVTVESGTDKKVVTVNMTPEPAGVEDVVADNANYVTILGSDLHYHVSAASTLDIFTLGGALEMRLPVNGKGCVSLQALPAGCYIYRLGAITGKVVLK